MKLEAEARKLILECFHKWIQVFGRKTSEQMPMRKLWDYAIDMKEGFMLKKRKVYLLLRKRREEVHKFISEQLRKRYIRSSKLPQIVLVFFIGKKDEKKHMVQDYKYLNEWTRKNNHPFSLISDIVENIDVVATTRHKVQ